MTASIAPPQCDGKAFEAQTIAHGDHLNIQIAIGVQSSRDESTKAGTFKPSSGEQSSSMQCAGKGKDRGIISDDGIRQPESSKAKKVVPTKAPLRSCVKLRFRPYPRRGSRRSAVSTQPGDASAEGNGVEEEAQIDIAV